MKHAFQSLSLAALLFSANACKNMAPSSDTVGPFDAQGNYIEAWADDPSKWRAFKPKDIEIVPPTTARNDQPPANSVPLPPPSAKPPVVSSPKPKTTPQVARNTATSTTRPRTTASTSGTKTSSANKTKPKAVAAKPKPKPQPATVRYTIKRGDTLGAIAARNGTSVAAIQRANGLSGTLIREGKTLVIPRRK